MTNCRLISRHRFQMWLYIELPATIPIIAHVMSNKAWAVSLVILVLRPWSNCFVTQSKIFDFLD